MTLDAWNTGFLGVMAATVFVLGAGASAQYQGLDDSRHGQGRERTVKNAADGAKRTGALRDQLRKCHGPGARAAVPTRPRR